MSTYSDAWQNTPPAIRDFYRNYHRRNLAHCWKAEYGPPPLKWIPFFTLGWSFQGYSGYALMMANLNIQVWLTGSFNVATVLLEVDPAFPPPSIQPTGPGLWRGSYPDQFAVVPAVGINYPRAKYKVRRQYWTGKPKRRRNI